MNRILPALVLAAALHAPAAFSAAPDAGGLAPFGWFGELAGSCWSGAHPDGKTRDTQCYESQYGRFVAGTIALTGEGGKTVYEGRALFAWDSKAGRIALWYWSSGGAWGSGEALREGERYLWPHPSRTEPGKLTQRSVWTRIDADSFRVAREKLEGEAWKEQFAVIYRRVPK